jgi:sterol desaturase/sphingolipid hydroxylase (fatty acid hydroxylase superfamily)
MEDFIEIGGGVLLGLCIGALALAFPFRRSTFRPTLLRDIGAAIASVVFAAAADSFLDIPEGSFRARLDGWYGVVYEAPFWLVALAYIVFADFCAYWAHRALHTRWLWPTHAWHHSPQHLYWIAGLRGSPIHMLVISAPYYLAFALFPVPEAGVIATVLFLIDTSNQHYIHSNLGVPFAAQLERVLVTPRFHFVHHSAREHVANSNYGFIFSLWDRMFGTFNDPANVASNDPLGLGYEISGWRLMVGLPAARRGVTPELAPRLEIDRRVQPEAVLRPARRG